MEAPLSAFFEFYQFPTGRRLFALAQVMKRAADAKLPDVVKHCNAALAHDRHCLDLERRWAGIAAEARGKGPPPVALPTSPGTLQLDALIDRTLTAIRDQAQNQTLGTAPDDPIRGVAASLLKEIFPSNVQDVTGLPFVEELAAVENILGKLTGKALAPAVKELGLERLVSSLVGLTDQYRAALQAPAPETLAFGQVRAARAEGQDLLLQTVAIVLGKFFRNTPEDATARAELLGPILEQQRAIAAALKGRRAVVEDVNPETGEPDPNATAPVPAGAGAPGQGGGGAAEG